ncbi:MAG TPA: S41 family peptidase [Gemmataceae bacterium]|nr:S41 family peptidase [Gemmataceae bacterium]
MIRSFLAAAVLAIAVLPASAREQIRLPNRPSLSPDGKTVAFDWNGDIWVVSIEGGLAKPLTSHPAKDSSPRFSPDGKEIAFISDREGSPQIFVMSATGGTPTQMTFHSTWTGGTDRATGYTLYEWTPDGKGWLVGTQWDHGWGRRNNDRLQIVRRCDDADKRPAPELLFDDYAQNGTLSPDGKTVLFNREGPEWWRKGYAGSQSTQMWSFDRDAKTFARVATGDFDSRWPMFGRDDKVYFTNGQGGCFNIWEHDRKTKQNRQVTKFTDDSTVFPAIARDGSTIVFRNLFDLYRIKPGSDEKPVKIEIFRDDDRPSDRIDRRVIASANDAAFTADGLEMALVIGGDLWVMDTELREPKRVTHTAEEERHPAFSPDGNSLYFVSDAEGKPEIWKATREAKRPWFLNDKFKLERVTDDGEEKSSLSFSPDGSRMAYIRGRGNLYVADADGKNAKQVIQSWNAPDYDWSPDGKWLVYALYDSDFNRDIWIKPIDGSHEPFNVSRHPYNESSPVWSPDGKLIAFVGERDSKEQTDIHYVWLRAQDEEKSARDRTLEKAMDKLKGRQPATPKKDPGPMSNDADEPPPKDTPVPNPKEPGPATTPKKEPVTVAIDFEGLHERVHRLSIPNSNESSLLWSPDSKKLAFQANVDGQSGTYTIEIPDNLKPSLITTSTGTHARWLKSGNIMWLSAGRPASVSTTGGAAAAATPTTPGTGRTGGGPRGGGGATPAAPTPAGALAFSVFQDIDLGKKHQAAFDMAWRTMRDNWYDDRLNNREWEKVRAKYHDVADTADTEALGTVVQLMLGELNGSHLGFTVGSLNAPARPGTAPVEEPTTNRNWRPVTPHLGVRFDNDFKGPGLKVKDVLPEGPADQKRSKLTAGDVITSIDGSAVDPTLDLTSILNGPPGREFHLKVKDARGKEREVTLRPITYTAARQLLYKKWLKDNRTAVEKLSDGKLGYLHISAMDMPSFRKFEEELYDAGVGKEGLVIDVRENGGGSTADHLLTALTQPRHAIAVPRGGGPGYPQDRTVYATWDKPIVVLCNQNSFSNAEIFSHAIKTLKRGHLVGVPTAGGVISTGGTAIMDVGFLRLPFRGWYTIGDGEDMERHGAVPDFIVWPTPGEGKDVQIEKAVEVLTADVKTWKERPQPKLKKASER